MHDLLVASTPPGKEHPHCDYCPSPEDAMTDEEINAKIADAVAPLNAQIAERDTKIADLERQLGERSVNEATEKAIADAVAPLTAQVEDLTTKLDDAEIKRNAAEKERDELVDLINTEGTKAETAVKRAARIDEVKTIGAFAEDVFSDEKADENAARFDRWADMDDEAWAAYTDDLKLKAPPAPKTDPPAPGGGPIPPRTALADVTEPAGGGAQPSATRRMLQTIVPGTAQTN